MSDSSALSSQALAARLERLTPQQRELLRRRLAPRAESAGQVIPARTGAADAALPLSAAQQRIWLFERLQPGSGAYHVYGHYRLRGELDIDAVQRAWSELVRRHDALRTGFGEDAGTPYQSVRADVGFEVALSDLSAWPAQEREAQMRRALDAETQRPFDLARPPLLRVGVMRLDAHDHVLAVVLHHIVSDAWSRGLLYREFAALYAAYRAGGVSPLAPPPLQFQDVVMWQREPAQQARMAQQSGFWRDALAQASGLLDLPTDRPRQAPPPLAGGRHRVSIDAATATGVADFAREAGATPFVVLLAAFQALLARHAGQSDVVVGTPVANRPLTELEGVVGLFVNTLALHGDLAGDPSFRELVERTRTHVFGALEHAEAPLESVIEELGVTRVPGRAPLFQVMFVLQNAAGGVPELPGLDVEWIEPGAQPARFELTLSLESSSDGIGGVIDYDDGLFDAATIARLAARYTSLLRAAIADPACRLSRIELVDAEERAELLALGDGGASAAFVPLSVLIATQSAATPAAQAIAGPGVDLSYAELQRRVNGIAHALRALGVGRETRVALLADRSAEAVLGLLGALAAGAAYVPLDPANPTARLTLLLGDAGVRVVLAPPALVARARAIAGDLPILVTDAPPPRGDAPPLQTQAHDAAYVIYTSGSTGTPKGVVVEQRGVVNLVHGFLARHPFAGHRVLMVPPLIFDASVGDVFPALASGATLVLHPAPAELGPAELERCCHDYAVSAIDAPAALWRRWSEAWAALGRTDAVPTLRLMMIGGESVPAAEVRRFANVVAGPVELHNHYGPTETSVCATTFGTRDASDVETAELPIGRPLPGTRLYVLDAALGLAPRGVVGELCIGGVGVARGYLGQPDLSARQFVPDAHGEPGARLYRSGDRARWNADGTLQFLGRSDQQTKLRGLRIELGEIETALAAHPDVRAAAAVLREDAPGRRQLVAYVVAGAAATAAALREHLAARLPEALVPSAFVALDALPLTPNGKVDRRALPAPPRTDGVREMRAPVTPTQHGVLAIWRELLGRDDLGIDDDFFASGGDSLLTLPLVFRLHAAFGVELPLPTVFAAPTVAALADAIEAARASAPADVIDLAGRANLPDDIDPARAAPPDAPREAPNAVLLTGATGFLGAHLLRELLDATRAEMYCLVRAADDAEALRRVRANLAEYGLWRDGDAARIRPVRGDLSTPQLGLDDATFADLAARLDVIFHNGGQVNFLAPYERLEAANVGGTRDVLRLAARTKRKAVHAVSTLGVYLTSRYIGTRVVENGPPPDAEDQRGGYNESKWVAERLLLEARRRGLPVALYRPARITGDSRSGASNLGDYLNAWIKGCVQLGLAPHLPDEAFDMAPVDYVAAAIVRLALGAGEADGAYHFFNARRLPIAAAIAELQAAGHALREISYPAWREALLDDVQRSRDNALAPFAGLFPTHPDPREPVFDCSASERALAPFGIACPPADRALFRRYLAHLHARGFLPARRAAAEAT